MPIKCSNYANAKTAYNNFLRFFSSAATRARRSYSFYFYLSIYLRTLFHGFIIFSTTTVRLVYVLYNILLKHIQTFSVLYVFCFFILYIFYILYIFRARYKFIVIKIDNTMSLHIHIFSFEKY